MEEQRSQEPSQKLIAFKKKELFGCNPVSEPKIMLD